MWATCRTSSGSAIACCPWSHYASSTSWSTSSLRVFRYFPSSNATLPGGSKWKLWAERASKEALRDRRNPARGSLTHTNHTACNKSMFGKISSRLYKRLYQSEVLTLFTKDTARRSQGTLGGVSTDRAPSHKETLTYDWKSHYP